MIVLAAIIGFTLYYMASEMRFVTVPGRVIARNVQDVMIDFPSKIQCIHVREGQPVAAGDVLVTLSLTDLQAQIKSKEHELVQAQNEIQAESSSIQQLQNSLNDAAENLRKSQSELKDKERLYQQGAISRYELDQAVDRVRADRKAETDLRLALDAKTQGISKIQAIQERIAKLRLELKSLREKAYLGGIQENRIVAKTARGIVCEIGYEAGDQVDDEKKILRILDLDSLIIEAAVAERLIKDVRIGAAVRIIPLADPSRQYQGRVLNISRMAVVKNGETVFPVVIELVKKDDFLAPNLNVEIKIEKGKVF